MAVYAVAQGRIENPELLAEYVSRALPTINAHGGRVVAFDETPEVVEGEIRYPRTVIVEFATMKEFRAWYESPEYQAVLPQRFEAAPGTLIVARGLPAAAAAH